MGFSGHETAIRRNSHRNSQRSYQDAHTTKTSGRRTMTMSSPGLSKENLDSLFLGSTATTFLQQFRAEQECTWKKIRQMLVWDNRTEVLIHRKHEKFRCHQVWAKSAVQHLDVQDVPRLAVITKPVTRTHAGTGRAQNWRRAKKEKILLPENKHVWMQGNRSNPLHQATNVLCQRTGIAHQKILANG